ncbi:MAG: hypothetical protein ACRDSR_07240 [Pseudonocardiaceae bacterium]
MVGFLIEGRARAAARAAAAAAVVLAATVVAPVPATAAGKHTTQSTNGLECRSSWYRTYGGTSCTGNSSQRWRLHITCRMQSDHKGAWYWGRGSDGFECTFGITSASVIWG